MSDLIGRTALDLFYLMGLTLMYSACDPQVLLWVRPAGTQADWIQDGLMETMQRSEDCYLFFQPFICLCVCVYLLIQEKRWPELQLSISLKQIFMATHTYKSNT